MQLRRGLEAAGEKAHGSSLPSLSAGVRRKGGIEGSGHGSEGGSRLRVGIGHGVAALEENEGEMETDGSRARVRCWGRLGRMGRPGRPMPWWVLLLLGCSASFFPFFVFLQTENKRKTRGEFGRI